MNIEHVTPDAGGRRQVASASLLLSPRNAASVMRVPYAQFQRWTAYADFPRTIPHGRKVYRVADLAAWVAENDPYDRDEQPDPLRLSRPGVEVRLTMHGACEILGLNRGWVPVLNVHPDFPEGETVGKRTLYKTKDVLAFGAETYGITAPAAPNDE